MSQLVVEHGGQTFYLGRIPSVFDNRNFNYMIADHIDTSRPPKSNTWTPGPVLDQGNTPSCTGHAARGWELSLPIADKVYSEDVQVPDPRATQIWQQAQLSEFGHIDPNDGATIHGIAKVLSDPSGPLAVNNKPRMVSYLWALTLDEVVAYLSYEGGLILGFSWYEDMFHPDANGIVHPTGALAGGHATYGYGVDVENKLIRIRNNWGSWGVDGDYFLTFDDFGKLLDQNGEICAGVEQEVDDATPTNA